jgi:hypothetical protein
LSREFDGEQLRREREELSETVAALAQKFDVPTRAREAAGSARAEVQQVWGRALRSPYLLPAAAGIGAVVALAASSGILRRHPSR